MDSVASARPALVLFLFRFFTFLLFRFFPFLRRKVNNISSHAQARPHLEENFGGTREARLGTRKHLQSTALVASLSPRCQPETLRDRVLLGFFLSMRPVVVGFLFP